jgi:hypothetical protein
MQAPPVKPGSRTTIEARIWEDALHLRSYLLVESNIIYSSANRDTMRPMEASAWFFTMRPSILERTEAGRRRVK